MGSLKTASIFTGLFGVAVLLSSLSENSVSNIVKYGTLALSTGLISTTAALSRKIRA
jgi:TctA family transporter